MNLFEAVEKWRIAAETWADAKDAADVLRETKNDVLEEIKSTINAGSNAERERLARTSERWKEHRSAMLEAERKERRTKLNMTLADKRYESIRTANANARSELYKHK